MTADERRRTAQRRQLKQSRKLRLEQARRAEEQRPEGIPVRRVPLPRPTLAPDAWERHAQEMAYRGSNVEVDHVVGQVRSRSGTDTLLDLRVENVGPPTQACTYVSLFVAGPALLDRLGGTSRWDRYLEAPWQLPLRRQGDPKAPCVVVWRRTGEE